MIIRDEVLINNIRYIKTYSDDNFMIQKNNTNEIYVEAIDMDGMNFDYFETDINIVPTTEEYNVSEGEVI